METIFQDLGAIYPTLSLMSIVIMRCNLKGGELGLLDFFYFCAKFLNLLKISEALMVYVKYEEGKIKK